MVSGTRGKGSRGRGRGGRKKSNQRTNQNVSRTFTPVLHSPTSSPNSSLPNPDLSLPFLNPQAAIEVTSVPFIAPSTSIARTKGKRVSNKAKGSGGLNVTKSYTPLQSETLPTTPNLSLRNHDLPPPKLDSLPPFIASQKVATTRARRSNRGRGRGRGGRGSNRDVTTGVTHDDVMTFHSPTPPPRLSVPTPESSSPTPESEEESLEGGANFTHPSSSTDEGSSIQEKESAGVNLSGNILPSPVEKKVIHIVGLNYMEQDVVRTITKDFKKHFYGKETQWHLLDEALVEQLYKVFQERYEYETPVDPEHARRVWEERAKIRCRGTWTFVRSKCIKNTGSTNPADWKDSRPNFVCQKDWEGILKTWMTEKWQNQSATGAKNRKKVPGVQEGGCLYVRHTGGSVNFGIHSKRLEIELGKKPSQFELFGRLHKREKGKGEWCDARAEKVAEKYQEKLREKRGLESESDNGGEQSSEVPFDPEAWVEATGGPKKNHVYGFGLGEEAETILNKTLASNPNKRTRNLTPEEIDHQIQAQVDARLDARIEALRAEMNEKMQLQIQEMLASLQPRPVPSSRANKGKGKGKGKGCR